MKMVKSLLLGSAAGLVAVAGAQAADLPVKAKPVQYVKICSLYGVGFYYIPGTDMCLKIGGWVRAEYTWGANGNIAWGWANGNDNNRFTNNSTWRARGYITADARNQTEYGTVRSYIAVGINSSDTNGTGAASFNANRAFIQWAGFTFGLAQSFFDFYSTPATAYWGQYPGSDTGDGGWMVLGYTAQFGNGFSATIAAEMRRMTTIDYIFPLLVGDFIIPVATSGYAGFQAPDVVGNLRVDQAWGSAQVMAAWHNVTPLYYNAAALPAHPDDKSGFAVGAGIKLNAPMIGQGDFFQAQVTYTQGALRYAFQTPNSDWFKSSGWPGTLDVGFGNLSDATYGGILGVNATELELTTAWGVNAAYEHFWNPRWRTSLYGGYAAVSYNDRANAMVCAFFGTANGTGTGSTAVAAPGCDSDWSTWWVGSRTQWNVTKDFYMGVDVMYAKLQTASYNGPSLGLTSSFQGPTQDQDNLLFRFRVHRDFYP